MKWNFQFFNWLKAELFKWSWKMKASFLMKFGGKNTMLVDDVGQKETETDNSRRNENGIQKIESEPLQKFEPRGLSEILSSASKGQFTNVELVSSPSMSLLDDTALHLFALMKRDTTSVNDACNCAKQMYSIMRLKLDAIKTQLGRDKK